MFIIIIIVLVAESTIPTLPMNMGLEMMQLVIQRYCLMFTVKLKQEMHCICH